VLRRVKRLAFFAALTVLLPSAGALLSGCGGGNGQLAVKLESSEKDIKAGDTPQFRVIITNNGPGDAPGVVVHVDMPANFRYKATGTIDAHGQSRTQLLDAKVGSASPAWGLWDLSAPTMQNGKLTLSSVAIPFTVDVEASAASYTLAARASGDNTAGDVLSQPIQLKVRPAPRLNVSATVSTQSLKARDKTMYSVTVTNSGSDIAGNVAVLVTLPPVMSFQGSVTPFKGNATRNNAVDPVRGSVLVFYSGFVLPPASSVGPGFVDIVFIAQVASHPAAGSFPINIQVTDDALDVVTLSNAAQVTVGGAGSASSSPSASASASATPSPSSGD
jgi:uncharacterized repeat protein (TIGR01451 family)